MPGQSTRIADLRGTALSQGDWTWIRTSVFMRWSNCHDKDKASVVLVIFSASPELRDRCERLWRTEMSEILVDPFGLLVICLDELWLQSQRIVDIVRKIFGDKERVCLLEEWQVPSRDVRAITIAYRPPLSSPTRKTPKIATMTSSGCTT